MKWINKHNKQEVALPHQISPGTWLRASIAGKDCEICWEPSLRTLFTRDQQSRVETPLKYRSLECRRYPGESFVEILLEYIGGTKTQIHLLRAEIAVSVPGLGDRKAQDASNGELVRSPMVGKVLRVLVANGDSVERGQELLVIEAMKMENKIFAKASGQIKKLSIAIGSQVKVGQALLEIKSS